MNLKMNFLTMILGISSSVSVISYYSKNFKNTQQNYFNKEKDRSEVVAERFYKIQDGVELCEFWKPESERREYLECNNLSFWLKENSKALRSETTQKILAQKDYLERVLHYHNLLPKDVYLDLNRNLKEPLTAWSQKGQWKCNLQEKYELNEKIFVDCVVESKKVNYSNNFSLS